MQSLGPISVGQRTICSSIIAVHFCSDATNPALLQDQTKAFAKFRRQKGKKEEMSREYRNHINSSIKYLLPGLSEGRIKDLLWMGMSPLPSNSAMQCLLCSCK